MPKHPHLSRSYACLSRLGMYGALLVASVLDSAAHAQATYHLTCGKANGQEQQLSAATRFAGAGGAAFGFDLTPSPTDFSRGSCASDQPFFVSAVVPDGSYQITVVLGSGSASDMTVRAESRRLFVMNQPIPANGAKSFTFNVHVRSEHIAGQPDVAVRVHLKPREIGALDWDSKLTLEFNGKHPGLRSIEIKPVPKLPVLYLAGDSTVVDQDKEPWAAWGQMLPNFFGPGLVVANEAESGETIRSFVSERRLDKILSTIKPGDTLMIQFAHNDQKAGTPEATDFAGFLQRYVAAAREHGASAILVTSMNRRVFDPAGHIMDTLGGYPQAMRTFATEQHLPLIDLNAMSKVLFEAMGQQGTLKAFVHYPANTFPGQPEELKDDTHFNSYGAYELARAVVQSIREQHLPLAGYLRPGIPDFDPAHPDPASSVELPPSPLVAIEKPYGN